LLKESLRDVIAADPVHDDAWICIIVAVALFSFKWSNETFFEPEIA
jgi:hypothetical protein